MRLEKKVCVDAPRERVWEFVSNPERYRQFMEGLAVAESVTDGPTRCGSRWSVRLLVGAAALGGTVEVVEYERPGDLALNAVTGLSVRMRWRLRERVPGRTDVTFRLAYQAPGGLSGLVAERVAAPIVRRRIAHSLKQLRDVVGTPTAV